MDTSISIVHASAWAVAPSGAVSAVPPPAALEEAAGAHAMPARRRDQRRPWQLKLRFANMVGYFF